MSCSPCHFSGSGRKLLARNVSADGPDRQLVGPRPEQAPLDAHLVAEIEQLEHRERLGADRVLPDVDLQRRRAVRQHEEVRLAERAQSEDPPRRPHRHVLGLERLTRMLTVRRDDVADAVGGVVGVGIRPDAEGEQFLVVGAALRDEFGIGHEDQGFRLQPTGLQAYAACRPSSAQPWAASAAGRQARRPGASFLVRAACESHRGRR